MLRGLCEMEESEVRGERSAGKRHTNTSLCKAEIEE